MTLKKIPVTIALCLGVLGAQVVAADGKMYSGNECQPTFGYQSDDFLYSTGGIYNRASEARYVTCPAIKDLVGATGGTANSYVNIYRDGSTIDAFQCWLYARNSWSSYVSSGYADTALSGSRGLKMNAPSSASNGVYYVRCRVPAYSYIRSYRIDEKQA